MQEDIKKGGRPAKTGTSPFTDIFRRLIDNDTQKAAAEKIGVSRQNISKWISGATTPDVDTLCRIADAYGVTTDYLLGRTKAKTSNVEMRALCDYIALTESHITKIKELCDEGSSTRAAFIGMLDFGGINDICKALADFCKYISEIDVEIYNWAYDTAFQARKIYFIELMLEFLDDYLEYEAIGHFDDYNFSSYEKKPKANSGNDDSTQENDDDFPF